MISDKMFPGRRLITLALLLGAMQLIAAAQTVSPEAQAANELFQAKKWPEAAQAYAAIVKTSPQDGRAWYRLGYSLHSNKNFEQAAVAFERSAEISRQPVAMYNAGASYARLGNQMKAFEWLKKAADAGFAPPEALKNDEDFAAFRTDPRFAEIVTEITVNAAPCTALPQYRQFDFWLGDWDVQGIAGNPPATNSIQSITGSCIIFENYTNGPYAGKSFSYYDGAMGKWHQTWVDTTGGSILFIGEYKDGAMRFEGESHTRTGQATRVKMTLFDLGADKVRQLGETSADEGKTWTVTYDLAYTRKKS